MHLYALAQCRRVFAQGAQAGRMFAAGERAFKKTSGAAKRLNSLNEIWGDSKLWSPVITLNRPKRTVSVIER